MRAAWSSAWSMRGVRGDYSRMLRVRVKYAKSMRDSFGGNYPILQVRLLSYAESTRRVCGDYSRMLRVCCEYARGVCKEYAGFIWWKIPDFAG
jgi:hypothetical protein